MENETSQISSSEPSLLRPSKWVSKELNKMSDLTANRLDGTFSEDDYKFLIRNGLNRYSKNSPWVAHAVFSTNSSGKQVAFQYPFPNVEARSDERTPIIYPLTNIETIERNGLKRHQAKGPDGRRWTAKRYEHAFLQNGSTAHQTPIEIGYFSEDDNDSDIEQDPSEKWGSNAPIPRFKSTPSSESIAVTTKGGHELTVEPASVLHRDLNKARGTEQNKVMDSPAYKAKREGRSKYNGHSARDAYEIFFKTFEGKLSEPMIALLKRAFQADIKKSPENQYRPEWLHGYGFSLTPLSKDPQRKENLGAAGAWANTEMTILESMAKWFALNQNSSENISITRLYTMLDQSELIDKIDFEVSIKFQERIIRFKQEIDALKETPIFRKGTDVAQATGIAHALLHDVSPISAIVVTPEIIRPAKIYKQVPEAAAFLPCINSTADTPKNILIFDLETTSLEHKNGKIIEFGGLLASFTKTQGILNCTDTYNGLQDPNEPLSDEVKDVTHITDEELKGQTIDWAHVRRMIEQADFVVCHNSDFDRHFFESNSPADIQDLIKTKAFGCTLQDIDWWKKGDKSRTLEDLNLRRGFKFTGHRAVNDCWATLNLLREVKEAIPELMTNIKKKTTLICAIDAPFDQKENLKRKNFRWSDGETKNIPKCWHAYVEESEVDSAKEWLDRVVYNGEAKSHRLPNQTNISATERYSERSELDEAAYSRQTAPAASSSQATANRSSKKHALEKPDSNLAPAEKKRKPSAPRKRKAPLSMLFKETTTKLAPRKEAKKECDAPAPSSSSTGPS